MSVSSDDFAVAPFAMISSHAKLFGVVNGTDPLQIEVPRFSTAHMTQSAPFTSAANTLQLEIVGTVNLKATDDSKITVSGLAGAQVECIPSLLVDTCVVAITAFPIGALFCASTTSVQTSLGKSTGVYTAGTSTLVLTLCRGTTPSAAKIVVASTPYTIQFGITNPSIAQASPSIIISASGSAPFVTVNVTKPGTEIGGVVGGADPLKIVEPALTTRSIEQSSVMISAVNTITASIAANVGIYLPDDPAPQGGTYVSICCLLNAIVSGDAVALSVRGGGNVPALCKDAAGTDGPGWGAWDATMFGVTMYLCPGENRTNEIVANAEFVVSFNITNPGESQGSPDVSVEAGSDAESAPFVASAVMTKPVYTGALQRGVGNITDVMYVVRPEFVIKSIGQSTPLAGLSNDITVTLQPSFYLRGSENVIEFVTKSIGQSTPLAGLSNDITVTLQPSFHLLGSENVSITLSGLSGAVIPAGDVLLSSVGTYPG
eukprot:CAMPEP_0180321864 /NCGR_PEP_ID=MMETSP0988-20121125/36374_1 /TAXON_ID=697907 /ORGANISM="non described non described, Strain CCMP2293" /LENGTH=487 /DNA_ID=CAMNT_0022307767 /DNA_START=8 /DNA_END=1469 /DNA_ORIENTATION=-